MFFQASPSSVEHSMTGNSWSAWQLRLPTRVPWQHDVVPKNAAITENGSFYGIFSWVFMGVNSGLPGNLKWVETNPKSSFGMGWSTWKPAMNLQPRGDGDGFLWMFNQLAMLLPQTPHEKVDWLWNNLIIPDIMCNILEQHFSNRFLQMMVLGNTVRLSLKLI